MKRFKELSLSLAFVALLAGTSFAQTAPPPPPVATHIFPISTANAADIVSIRADIVVWGAGIIGLGLAFLAYRKVRRVVTSG